MLSPDPAESPGPESLAQMWMFLVMAAAVSVAVVLAIIYTV
jgi:hypothetical protein